ncbi:unnamed protein product [Linum tenue]|uniref:Uncharacterized protein n=1 Tax=Linum tenue TaxID=586396 RepID=A0AAV0LDB6_9ROSI|nr:unnamed protein product [Linum tenue]
MTVAIRRTTQPLIMDAIDEFRYSSSWCSSLALHLDTTAAALQARFKELQLAEGRVEEGMKELERKKKEVEKEIEAAKRTLAVVDARDGAFELLTKREISGQKKHIEAELEEKRREVEAKEKGIEECLKRFGLRVREKGFEEQLAELQVRLSQLISDEGELDEEERQWRKIESNTKRCFDELRAKENELERRVVEFNRKVATPYLRLAEVSKGEKYIDERETELLELKVKKSLNELKSSEEKLMDKCKILDKRIKDVELKEKQLEERLKEFDPEEGQESFSEFEKKRAQKICREGAALLSYHLKLLKTQKSERSNSPPAQLPERLSSDQGCNSPIPINEAVSSPSKSLSVPQGRDASHEMICLRLENILKRRELADRFGAHISALEQKEEKLEAHKNLETGAGGPPSLLDRC